MVAVSVLPPIEEEFVSAGQVKVQVRPIAILGEESELAAQAAECAADQGRFWEFIDIAYARQEALNRKVLPEWAAEAGVRDADLFGRCFASDIKRKTVLNDLGAGRVQGVRGTPTFFVNGTLVRGAVPYEALQQLIVAELNR